MSRDARDISKTDSAKKWLPESNLLLIAASLGLLAFFSYANSFRSGFVLDNRPLILEDPRIREAIVSNVALIFQHTYWWPKGETRLYRPVTTLSYLFNYSVLGNGEQPDGYHWFNLTLHSINVALVFLLCRRILRNLWPSFFVTAVWSVHPLLTESVTNIIGRSDLLAAACVLSGFLFYLKGTESTGRRQFAWLAALGAVTLIGVFSKESAVAILGILVLFEITWWKDRRNLRGLLLGCLAMTPAFLALFFVRSAVFSQSVSSEVEFLGNPLSGANFVASRLTAISVMARYLWLLVWPSRLSCDYSFSAISLVSGSAWDWVAWTTIAILLLAALLQFARNKVVFFFAAFAFITFVPTSNLFFTIGTIMAERFMYLPAIAFSVCLVLSVYFIAKRFGNQKSAPALLCLVIAAFAVRTWVRNADWQDENTLWASAVRTVPRNFKAHAGLAAALFQSDPAHTNIDRVIEQAEKSVAILDPVPDTLNTDLVYADAGLYYMTQGSFLDQSARAGKPLDSTASRLAFQRAEQLLKRGAAIAQAFDDDFRKKQRAQGKADSEIPPTGLPRLYANLAENSWRLGDPILAYDAALRGRLLDPQNLDNYQVLSDVLVAQNRKEDATVPLVEGMMISHGQAPQLAASLRALYGTGIDPKGCAFLQGPGGLSLNNLCEPVHKDLCKSSAELAVIYRRELRLNTVDRIKQNAVQLGCPADAAYGAL